MVARDDPLLQEAFEFARACESRLTGGFPAKSGFFRRLARPMLKEGCTQVRVTKEKPAWPQSLEGWETSEPRESGCWDPDGDRCP